MNFLIFLLYLGIFCITGGIIFRKAVEKMKDSQIRVCGRAAQTDSGAGGAVMFGCLAAAAVAGGFMTAGARLLLNASAVTSALSSVSRLLSPALNTAACLLLTLAVAALIAPPGQGMKRYYLLCALGKKRRASECVATFRGRRAFRALRLRIALAALNLALRIFFLLPGAALAAGGIYMLFSSSVGVATTAAVFAGSVLMLVTGCIFCSGTRQSLAAAEYISAAEPDIPVRQALKKSREIMCGHCRAYARFKAGFALWFLSCALILPAFFVVPYYEQSCAVWMTETVKLGQKSSFYTE
jgi:hypothetical protein